MTDGPVLGQPAPELRGRDQHGQDVSLGGLRGAPVVLVFYPFAFSGICTGELCEIRDDLGALQADGVTVLAISCDPVYALRAFAEAEGFTFGLLSDFWPHGAIARDYGVFDEERGCAVRGTFVIDAEGVLRWSVVNGLGEARDLADYHQALAALR